MFGIYIHNLDFHLIIHKNNKNCTIPYFINLISDRANFAVSGPTSFRSCYFCINISKQWNSCQKSLNISIYLWHSNSTILTIKRFFLSLQREVIICCTKATYFFIFKKTQNLKIITTCNGPYQSPEYQRLYKDYLSNRFIFAYQQAYCKINKSTMTEEAAF